jgi:serine/threonine-protein kinase RsbT
MDARRPSPFPLSGDNAERHRPIRPARSRRLTDDRPTCGRARTVRRVGGQQYSDVPDEPAQRPDIAALIPMVRRVVGARVTDDATADDLVQETLTRVLAAAPRVAPEMLEPYAIVTARNVVASLWREQDRHRRNQHRVADTRERAS